MVECFNDLCKPEYNDKLYSDINMFFKRHRNVSLCLRYDSELSKIFFIPNTIDGKPVNDYEANYYYPYFYICSPTGPEGKDIFIVYNNIILPKRTLFFRSQIRNVSLCTLESYVFIVNRIIINYYERNVIFEPCFDFKTASHDFGNKYLDYERDYPVIYLDGDGNEIEKEYHSIEQSEDVF